MFYIQAHSHTEMFPVMSFIVLGNNGHLMSIDFFMQVLKINAIVYTVMLATLFKSQYQASGSV